MWLYTHVHLHVFSFLRICIRWFFEKNPSQGVTMLLHGWAFCPIWSCCSFWAHAMIAPWSTLHGSVSQVERKLRIPQIPIIPKSKMNCCRFDWVQSEKKNMFLGFHLTVFFKCLSIVLTLRFEDVWRCYVEKKPRQKFWKRNTMSRKKRKKLNSTGGVACGGLEINDEREITALCGWPTESLTLSTRATGLEVGSDGYGAGYGGDVYIVDIVDIVDMMVMMVVVVMVDMYSGYGGKKTMSFNNGVWKTNEDRQGGNFCHTSSVKKEKSTANSANKQTSKRLLVSQSQTARISKDLYNQIQTSRISSRNFPSCFGNVAFVFFVSFAAQKNQGETQKQSRRDVGCDSICHGGCNAPIREDSTRTGALPALIFARKVMLYQNHGQEEFAFFVFCRNYSHSHTRFLTQPIVWSHPSENGILDYMHNYPMIMPCYIRLL